MPSGARTRRRSLGAGANVWVAVSTDGDVMTSPNGVNWVSRTPATASVWQSVQYGAGLFVAVGNNAIQTSPDGITWTGRTSPVNANWRGLVYADGLFVAVAASGASNRVMTSPDGINWTAQTASTTADWISVTYGNGLYVAVANSGTNRVMTSPDGVTWTARSASEASGWTSVTFGDDLFVAVANTGTNRCMTSPDGTTWTSRTIPSSSWFGIAHGAGLYVAVAGSGTDRVVTSPDGITWTARTPGHASTTWRDLSYSRGKFVCVAQPGSSANLVQSSPDGITWTGHTAAAESAWFDVVRGSTRLGLPAPIGHWPMQDASGTAMTALAGPEGVYSNSPTLAVTGPSTAVPNAVEFDGTNDYASVTGLDLSAYYQVTVAFWLWRDSYSNDDRMAVEYGESAEVFRVFSINPNYSSGTFAATVSSGNLLTYKGRSITRPSTGAWHHYIITVDRGDTNLFKFYVDGVLTSSTITIDGAVGGFFETRPLYVMSRAGSSLFCAGKMADLRIYANSLTAEEAAVLYGSVI